MSENGESSIALRATASSEALVEDNGEREAWSGSCRQQFNVFCADRNKDRLDVMEAKLSGKIGGKNFQRADVFFLMVSITRREVLTMPHRISVVS
jgi:hypothetical protein